MSLHVFVLLMHVNPLSADFSEKKTLMQSYQFSVRLILSQYFDLLLIYVDPKPFTYRRRWIYLLLISLTAAVIRCWPPGSVPLTADWNWRGNGSNVTERENQNQNQRLCWVLTSLRGWSLLYISCQITAEVTVTGHQMKLSVTSRKHLWKMSVNNTTTYRTKVKSFLHI